MKDVTDWAEGSILAGAQIAIRYNVIPDAQWFDGDYKSVPDSWLRLVHKQLEGSQKATQYVKSLASFYADVTIPFTTREQLPVTALVELDEDRPPARVEIVIDGFATNWEGNDIHVPPTRLVADFRETLTLFESGHIVYTPSFLIHPSADVSPVHITALTSLVSTPSAGYGQSHDKLRGSIRFWRVESGEALDLVSFFRERIRSLVAADSADNVIADIVRPVLKSAGWSDRERDEARDSIAALEWGHLRSASVEMVHPRRYDEFVSWCVAAPGGNMEVDDDRRAFAALAQNILDWQNQDKSEVADSLAQAVGLNGEFLLIHPKMTFRCSRNSRTFNEMCSTIGGCPYVMLTEVILAYNEYLLDQSARLIDQIQQSVRKPGWSSTDSNIGMTKVESDLKKRTRLFELQSLHALPNVFRYPTERKVFEAIEMQRGLGQRSEGINRFTHRLYELRKDITDLAERRDTRRINAFLCALSILQVSGLFLTALTSYATFKIAYVTLEWQEWGWLLLFGGLVATVGTAIIAGVWPLIRDWRLVQQPKHRGPSRQYR